MGKVRGSANEKNKVLKDDLQAQQKATNFYKKMAEHENDNITDRKSLTKRLRGNGLQDEIGSILSTYRNLLSRI